jgi:hypothetical protein
MVFSQTIAKLLGGTDATPVLPTLPHLQLKGFSVAASTQYAYDWIVSLYPTRADARAIGSLLDGLCSPGGQLVQAASVFYSPVI